MVAAVVSAVVGALVGAALSPVTNNVMAQIFKIVDKDNELWKGFKKDMASLKTDLGMLAAASADQLSGNPNTSAERRICMESMQELLYDIQDCVDRILRYSECGGAGGSRNLAEEVGILKERLKDAREQQRRSRVNDTQPLPSKEQMGKTKVPPVGIDEPMEKLRMVLEGHPEELSVISIVGFSGMGKTTLAREVYNCYNGADQFQCLAWVVASEHEDDESLLTELRKKLLKKDMQRGDVETNISSFLKGKRYLIVLDDIEKKQWERLSSTFPVETKSRIIVTTTSQRVARFCCKHGTNGYVYNMKPLGKGNSKRLLKDILKDRISGFDKNSDRIVEKLGGHPLSLVCMTKYLLELYEFPTDFWNNLDDCMRDQGAFSELQQVLIKNFNSLKGHYVNLKVLLLYLCVVPNTHPIGRSRLIRRWLAEGYVQDPDPCKALRVADRNLEELFDLNIIGPMHPSKNAKAKTCRVHGIMHDFLLSVARSINFISDIGDRQRNKYRHLFLEGRPPIGGASNVSDTSCDETEKPRVHSLTVCGRAAEAVGYFPKCELLRVLDLEECNELEDKHTSDIQKLWHLKYLSLGANVKEVPSGIEKLQCLETLDMRKTMEVIELPLEVIKLTQLAHLLGKFKLVKRDWENIRLDKLLPRRSNLQMLTGFLTDDNPGFPKLMVHMNELSKVKIWCNSVGNKDGLCFAALLTAIKLFVQSRLDTCGDNPDHSLSLDLSNSSQDILTSLYNSIQLSTYHSPAVPGAYLSSLKLHGDLCGLTQFTTLVAGLRELCLSSTNGLTTRELLNLRGLIGLEYLKLVKVGFDEQEPFVIRPGDLRALRRLCLVQCRGLPQIKNGSLTDLIALQILNEDLGSQSGVEIKNLIKLQEIGLDSEVKQKTKTDWENAAMNHPQRPTVLFFKRVDVDGMGSKVKYFLHRELDEEAKPTAQVNREGTPSNSQNPSSGGSDGGLNCGNSYNGSGPRADDLGQMKESNDDTGDEDDGKGKNDKSHKSFADDKAKQEVVGIKEAAADGSTSSETTSLGNCNGKGKVKVDEVKAVKECKELDAAKAVFSAQMMTDDRLKPQDDGPVMVKAN